MKRVCHTLFMKKPRISIIVAIGKNHELGRGNELIWRIPEDFKRMKALTTGHPIIMGRKTFESIGKPLPNRTNIVITRTQVCIEGCLVFDSFQKAMQAAESIDTEEIFIFGGASIYTEALPYADRLYLTIIDAEDTKADTFFPEYPEFTKVIEDETHTYEGLSFTFLTLERE